MKLVLDLPESIFLFLAVTLSAAAMACNSYYESAIKELCLAKFKEDMEALDQGHWCSWEDTVEWVAAYFTPHCYCLCLPVDLKWTSTVIDQWKLTWRPKNPEAIYLEYFKPFPVHSFSFWNVSKTDSNQSCKAKLLNLQHVWRLRCCSWKHAESEVFY